MRRPLVIAGTSLGIALLAVLLVAALAPPDPAPPDPLTEEHRDRRITFEGYDSGVWPYLSSEQSFRRTSPINVVVKGEPAVVMEILQGGDGNFQNLSKDQQGATAGEQVFGDPQANASSAENLGTAWESTEGATRFAYVDDGDGDGGLWIDETAQLQDGTYYGHRHHIRVYASPAEDEPWVAIQAHSEHFDWFTLRHEVHGTEAAQNRVEGVFLGDPRVEDLWRGYVANDDSSDSDGWASMIVLTAGLLAPVGLALAGKRRRDTRVAVEGPEQRHDRGTVEPPDSRLEAYLQRHLTPVDRRRLHAARDRFSVRTMGLVATIVGLVLGVRFGGIALERHAGFLSMHAIAALLYPFMGVGIPVATYAIASGIERRMDGAVAASGGLAIGVFADYAYLGIDMISMATLLQRMSLIFALGLLAAGAARRAADARRINGLVIAGAVLWIVFNGATLLGYI